MRNDKMITKGEMSWAFIKITSLNFFFKECMEITV